MRCASTGSRGACSSCRLSETGCEDATAGRGRRRGQSGFSLIEVLVALVVLTVGLGSLYSAFSTALNAAGRVDSHVAAIQLAQSLLDQHTAGRVLKTGVAQGRDGAFAWSVSVVPADDEIAPSTEAGAWQLQRIVVSVAWPRQRQFTLETLHVARLQ
jgi:general secretion pathway protein I